LMKQRCTRWIFKNITFWVDYQRCIFALSGYLSLFFDN
jgi:hypothetical protein